MMDVDFGITRTFKGTTFEAARERIVSALAEEGFGILTEIDVKATLKKKLDREFRNYVILGACNPPIAHQALVAEMGVGLLLPCNVVVTEDDHGNAVVSMLDPGMLVKMLPDPSKLQAPMTEARERLVRALEKA